MYMYMHLAVIYMYMYMYMCKWARLTKYHCLDHIASMGLE